MLKPWNALNLAFIPAPKKIINFGYDSKDLSDKALKILEQTTELIIQQPNREVIINGYTDSVGDDSYNKELSKSRANIVKNFFVGRGISPSRIKTFGLGQKNPIGSNKTLEGRTLNRRVEIKLNTRLNHNAFFSGAGTIFFRDDLKFSCFQTRNNLW